MRRTGQLIIIVALCLSGCRASWQHPDRVITSLGLKQGDHVADIGAGDGYFTFLLADAVGPEGKVYAVEVTDARVRKLARRVEKRDYENVEVIFGQLDDPLLPDKAINLAFVCNTYHHIDNRPTYFSRLRADLRQNGRVAIIEPRDDLTGIPRLFVCPDHWTPKNQLYEEMDDAGYERMSSFDFLPAQNFEVFAPRRPGSSAGARNRAGPLPRHLGG